MCFAYFVHFWDVERLDNSTEMIQAKIIKTEHGEITDNWENQTQDKIRSVTFLKAWI